MANIKSQIKRNRQTARQYERNLAVRSRVRTYTKRFATAVDDGDRTAAESAYSEAARELDKAATKGVIHRNNAANRKSGMAKRLATL